MEPKPGYQATESENDCDFTNISKMISKQGLINKPLAVGYPVVCTKAEAISHFRANRVLFFIFWAADVLRLFQKILYFDK